MDNEKKLDSNEQNSESNKTIFDNLVWLSTKDAAIYLRKFRKDNGKPSEGAIRTLIWRGAIKARKWQRRLFIKKSDLDRILQNSPFSEGEYA